MLADRVTIVIHAAASVRFDDKLKYAIFVNARSTRDICILAENMKNLVVSKYDRDSTYVYILSRDYERFIYIIIANLFERKITAEMKKKIFMASMC